MGIKESAIRLGVEQECFQGDTPVITGFAQETSLGNTEETWQGLLQGRSGVKKFVVNNFRTNIAAPFKDPYDYFDPKERKLWSRVTALAVYLSRKAGEMRGIIGDDGRLLPTIDRNRVGVCISSGIGASHQLIDINNTIHNETDKNGNEDPIRGSRRINPFAGLRLFPEQINAQVAQALGLSGWPINTSEACATGAASIVEAGRLVLEGKADIVFAGGVEDVLHEHPDVSIGIFAALRALSARNNEPEKASRPFDGERDGFVISSGGGIVVVEGMNHALKRGTEIKTVLLGFEKSIDGKDSTESDPEQVARTISRTLRDKQTKKYYKPDVIFAHATSTQKGDPLEAQALRTVFEEELPDIPITALKDRLGHTLGAAGAINVVCANQSLESNTIPPMINLETVGKTMEDLYLVRQTPLKIPLNRALAAAYGFGGHNAVVLLGKYKE